MGKAPLKADLRKLCDCTGGCDFTWQGPQKRIWATWPTATVGPYQNLVAGILMEIVEASIAIQQCSWIPSTAFFPFVTLFLTRSAPNVQTGSGGGWVMTGVNMMSANYVANNTFLPDQCEGIKGLPQIVDTFTPPISSAVILSPVAWYQNADDVPH